MELRWLQDVEPSVEFGRNADTVDTLTLSFIAIPITNNAANAINVEKKSHCAACCGI
ncbi:MAG TPA: hypothetical protein VN982_06260 [Candidatus Dormibacteraeota bacterium]|nr:hypothetical protein [Candidatus Dormibacteraeota bacterium]